MQQHRAGGPVNTLTALAAEVPRHGTRRGLAVELLRGMRTIAERHGLDHLVAPLRPMLKDRYPLVPIEEYVAWRREDGSAFDPWIRVHERLGARVATPLPTSFRITGTVADWESWTDMAFPVTGDYVFPEGLALLHVDRDADRGSYWEPNVWLVHPDVVHSTRGLSTVVDDDVLRQRAAATRLAYFALGNQVSTRALGLFVCNLSTPLVRDANFAVPESNDCDRVLAWSLEAFRDLPHVAFKLRPDEDDRLEARLVSDGWNGGIDLLELVLRGALAVEATSSVSVRPVSDDVDRAALTQLKHADWADSAARTGVPAPSMSAARQLVASKLVKCPPVQYLLATIDGVDCAFVSSWEGVDGMGVVEDLFTMPDHRHRGAATTLIAAAVDHARARGAADVLIGADPQDTPKAMYRDMGFRPCSLQRGTGDRRRRTDPTGSTDEVSWCRSVDTA